MDLLEYQGKAAFFARHACRPAGQPARARWRPPSSAAEAVGYPCAIKAQVQDRRAAASSAGSRSPTIAPEAERHSRAMCTGMDIRGLTFASCGLKRLGDSGGVLRLGCLRPLGQGAAGAALDQGREWDIEQVADEDPDALAHLHGLIPLLGFQDFHGRRWRLEAGVDADVVRPVGSMLATALRGLHQRGGDAGRRSTR